MTKMEKRSENECSGKAVVLKLEDFVEMKCALAAAWQMRNKQCANMNDECSTADQHAKWSEDFDKWFDLDRRTNSVGKPVIIRDPDGGWTNANIRISEDEITVRPDYSRPFRSE